MYQKQSSFNGGYKKKNFSKFNNNKANSSFNSPNKNTRAKDMPDGEYIIALKLLNTLRNNERNKDFLEWVVEDVNSKKRFSLTSGAFVPGLNDQDDFFQNTPFQALLQAVNAEEEVRRSLGGRFVNTPDMRKIVYSQFSGNFIRIILEGGKLMEAGPADVIESAQPTERAGF